MSSKFLLIPEDMYHGLLSSALPKEDTNLIFTKEELDASKNKQVQDKSAKNVLYNQELRRFLKLRKEAENKPVKVELSDGSKMVKRHISPTALIVDPNADEEGSAVATDYDTAVESAGEELGTSGLGATLENNLLQVLNSNKRRFGITDDGMIRGDNQAMTAIRGSNLTASVRAILNRNPEMRDPPGTYTLRKRLMKSQVANRMLNRAQNALPQSSSVYVAPNMTFRVDDWSQ